MSSLNDLGAVIYVKYSLAAEVSAKEVMNTIRSNIKNTYDLWVSPETARNKILAKLAEGINEPLSKMVIKIFSDLVDNLNDYSVDKINNRLEKISNIISEYATPGDTRTKIRSYVHDSLPWKTQADKNAREKTKNELDVVLGRIGSMISKERKKLERILLSDKFVPDGHFTPERKELSKQRLLNFIYSPEAQQLGLDDLDSMEKILSYPDLKEQLTTIINAIDRGRESNQVPDFSYEASELLKAYSMKREKDNSELFEEEI